MAGSHASVETAGPRLLCAALASRSTELIYVIGELKFARVRFDRPMSAFHPKVAISPTRRRLMAGMGRKRTFGDSGKNGWKADIAVPVATLGKQTLKSLLQLDLSALTSDADRGVL